MMNRIKRVALSRPLLVLVLALCSGILSAHTQGVPTSSPVILDGNTVITIRWGYGNSTPAARARAVEARLKVVAEDPGVPLNLTPRPSPLTIDIRCGNVILCLGFYRRRRGGKHYTRGPGAAVVE